MNHCPLFLTSQFLSADICIVGNGIISKTAALAMAASNLKVILIVSSSSIVSESLETRVYAFNHITYNLLKKLKIWDMLDVHRIVTIDSMKIFGDLDDCSGHLELDSYKAHLEALAWVVENNNLVTVLDMAINVTQNIRVIHAYGISLQQNSIDHISLTLDNNLIVQAKLLIGADGSQSWVRSKLNIGLDCRIYDHQAIVGTFFCEKPHYSIAYQWFTNKLGILALLPLSNQRVSLVWSAPHVIIKTLSLNQSIFELIQQQLSKYIIPIIGHLTPTLPEVINHFPLMLIKPHTVIAKRVVLVGDAAHVIHPLAGYGMNLGFSDIATLLKILRIEKKYSQQDYGAACVLKRYLHLRKKEVFFMQVVTNGLILLFENNVRLLRLVSNLGLNVLNHIPFLKQKLINFGIGKHFF